ncbi:MAG: gliding motility protein GldM, partial [Chitinophagaceae bacterium]|nr:gliding motility protein GldM [Chitinophagaceae bacterium]
MSLPKEPRQKMINMMYLVLTALLALNVSSEILNAFKTVDRSLMTANGIVDKKNAEVFRPFQEKMK